MKISQSKLKQIIREEIEENIGGLAPEPTISLDLTQREANALVLALEDRMDNVPDSDRDLRDLYSRIINAGLDVGFGA